MLYNDCKRLRDRYLEDGNNIQLSVLTQLFSQYFGKGDELPSKVTIKVNIKEHIRPMYNYRKHSLDSNGHKPSIDEFAMRFVAEVFDQLDLEYTSIYIVKKHIFEYTFEVSFSKKTIKSC